MSTRPKILIICFTFPPYEGIGGRRWAKFCKYLHRSGVEFEVLAADRGNKNNNWLADIELFADKITYLPSGYPSILFTVPNTIFQKIKYKMALLKEVYFYKGNPYDYSRHWQKHLNPALVSKLNQGFDAVIYSMLPFRGAYFTSLLKNKFPKTQFILDVRDPWSNNKTGFGFENLKLTDLQYEQQLEQKALVKYDKILSVSQEILDFYVSKYGIDSKVCFELKNGFDTDEIVEAKPSSEQIKIVFVGTLYQKAEHAFNNFVNSLLELKKESPELLYKVQFDFYGNMPPYFQAQVQAIDCIRFMGKVSTEQAAEAIAQAHAAMLFMADDTNYSFSTKFYEYVCNKKPILVFGKPGKTSKFVQENEIGFEIPLGNEKQKMAQAIEQIKGSTFTFNSEFDTKSYEIKSLTEKLINIIYL